MESGKSTTTKDHGIIKKWIEDRDGVPATVATTEHGGSAGIIRVMFPQTGNPQNLKEISWDEFFKRFDENNLQFLYQEKTKDGQISRFFKFVRT